MLFRFRHAVIEVVQELPKRNDEVVEDVARLLIVDLVASFDHAGVDLNHLLFNHSHVSHRDKIQDVLSIHVYSRVDFTGVEEIKLVHGFIYEI